MPRRIDAGEVLAALGGLVVFVSLFLSWFETATGWEAFESLDLVIAALAIVAVFAAVTSILGSAAGPSPRVLPWVGGVLLAIVVVQLIEPPPVFSEIDPDREVGAWLALAGSALLLLGGVLRAASISVTVSVGGRDARRRVPAVDRRPASPAASEPPASPEPSDPQHTQPFSALDDR
jgi:drug/metabolite transporter superfamily protein YnfA